MSQMIFSIHAFELSVPETDVVSDGGEDSEPSLEHAAESAMIKHPA